MKPMPAPVIPRSVLLDALSGWDLEITAIRARCRICRGAGKLQVAKERERRTCPICRGSVSEVKR